MPKNFSNHDHSTAGNHLEDAKRDLRSVIEKLEKAAAAAPCCAGQAQNYLIGCIEGFLHGGKHIAGTFDALDDCMNNCEDEKSE